MSITIQQALGLIQAGISISEADAESVFGQIMKGEATHAQIGALLMGLSIRGETADVIAGAARAMRAAATRIEPKSRGLLDTCGTGGDGASTFNISTTVALVVAAAGQPVAKHGNRAISSKSGSADVLEALGVKLDLAPQKVADCIDAVGIGFLFAPGHHPAMKHASAPRRELGMRSIFNLLGPLTNPAGAGFQVLGVYARDKLDLVAGALNRLGIKRALVVHGRDGLDEITTTCITDAVWVEHGHAPRCFEIDPAAFGMPYASPAELAGGDATANAAIIRDILNGASGAARDIVLLNAAAALWVAGRAEGIPAGLRLAAEAIDSGKASQTLTQLVTFTQNADA
ncbi:MAG: anthranilate phosphoribosyltransferase [Zetaproteobacteria bacterium CG06_land_8_20_14_3_00_59_53]|nr:MAG: anthranilate phosphoribosyltransferase [Zetaproteobacteria bacterium CG2_30_59_37]PIO88941.1 MAG: anthranilate phosphoribosyltransferase [Zetaproteobacteria bacterium CG23_combo_of_CG06-09_8_20_14_all_59_86]PIQ65244.1 MAG: anthranilate phosphoribosyltransferase [Zetaproteobacteria bacterium CG11_big_fil_rev_8_21_14_0_20_59_439]PIU70822.1 MAG: anthranilate phosphoribosyltransferase [Zetaproteobacteria bacterium CG06_land_8_20_14_3_00_59_53]PIU96494.1 MAG: anthranilate phosphoribosyltrans